MDLFNIKKILNSLRSRFIKSKVLAVHENDIEKLLKNLNLFEDIRDGKILCSTCGKKIDINSIGGFIKKKGSIKIFCDQSNCISDNY